MATFGTGLRPLSLLLLSLGTIWKKEVRSSSRAEFGLGIRHLNPDQGERHEPSQAEPCKRGGLAEVIRDNTPDRIAECGAEPDSEPDYSHSHIETTAAPCDIGDHQWQHHANN
jgi:hypothetical protein